MAPNRIRHYRDAYASASGDRADCAVRALSVAACIPYEQAAQHLLDAGRRKGACTRTDDFVAALVLAGFERAKVYMYHGKMTVGRFAATYPVGHFVVRVSGHMLAICDGIIHDWRLAPRRPVKTAWRLDC